MWVVQVQVQLVIFYLSRDKSLQRLGVGEDAIVRPRQVFHHRWERIVKLFGEIIS